jgi:ectoine hydroxylase-related dioxygenase (phytanoyl-CoA dioxygenase family)
MATATWETERTDLSEHIRDVTDEEIAHFQGKGWALLRGLVSEELVAEILQHYKDWSGLHWNEFPEDPAAQAEFVRIAQETRGGRRRFGARQDDPWMFNYVTQPKLGEAAGRLLGVRAIRPLSETMQIKLPLGTGDNGPTIPHQDYPYFPIDRADAIQFWLALVPVAPEMGAMVHLSGSHHEPPRGMTHGEDPLEVYPHLLQTYEVSQPQSLRPGDALTHHSLTFHLAGPNQTQKVRWAMTSYRMDADCLYTGQPNFNTDNLGLEFGKPFDHPNFPVVWER